MFKNKNKDSFVGLLGALLIIKIGNLMITNSYRKGFCKGLCSGIYYCMDHDEKELIEKYKSVKEGETK